jgi:nitrogen-specific signal transduction histidine kinase
MIYKNNINAFEVRRFIKIILLLLAVLISILTLYLSQRLVNKIAVEETKKMEIWADAERILSDPDAQGDLGFELKIIQSNETIPAILVSETGRIIQYINIGNDKKTLNDKELQEILKGFSEENTAIRIPIDEQTTYRVYYGKSSVLKQLEYYPYVVLAIVGLFVLVSYSAFSYSTRSEQNQVWVGLAKETAHQLGTPISSLMGWITCIENDIIPDNAAEEMKKDVDRLKIITERFSKIGSEPILKVRDFNRVVRESLEYMESRIGRGVAFDWDIPQEPLSVMMNVNLFQWVIENLVKNSVDAMDGSGALRCTVESRNNKVYMDITDTGKGISRSQVKDIFKPGFTTKKRGWGLGLSLAKRIVEDYHQGLIFVKESTPFKRTTIRVQLSLAVELKEA